MTPLETVGNKIEGFFTPFRIEDAQSNRSNPFISAPEGGILNENWCKIRVFYMIL